MINSSSGSWHSNDGMWQEIGRTCGSACSCPRPGSRIVVPSRRMCTASLIHLVLLSDSLSKIVPADQLITWFSCNAWSVIADLFCSDRLDARWPMVKGLLVMDSTSVLCSSVFCGYQTVSDVHVERYIWCLTLSLYWTNLIVVCIYIYKLSWRVCLSKLSRLFVCLCSRFRKNVQTDFNETLHGS